MIIQGSQKQLAEKASAIICEATLLLLKTRQRVVMAVPGGRSVAGIYKNLRNCAIPWDRVHMFLLDERLVPVDHPESNFKLIKKYMGSGMPPRMIHQFKYNADNPGQDISEYEEELNLIGGRFDIVLASSGEDGHIASLFPGHHSVEQTKSGFFLQNDSPKPPPGRMSASYNLIRQADTGIILFFGEGKRNALGNFLNVDLSYKECPAKIITELSTCYLLTDLEVEKP